MTPIGALGIALGVLTVVFTVLGLVLWLHNKRLERLQAKWQAAADAHGLTLGRGLTGGSSQARYGTMVEFDISGEVQGVEVKVANEKNSYGQAKELSWGSGKIHPPLDAGLQVSTKGVFEVARQLVGDADIKTGDARFDRRFDVRAQNQEAALRALDPDVREALLRMTRYAGTVKLTDDEIFFKTTGSLSKDDAVKALILTMAVVAQGVINADRGVDYLPEQEDAASKEVTEEAVEVAAFAKAKR